MDQAAIRGSAQNCGFKVDALMFDPHQNDPHGTVELDGQGKIAIADEAINDLAGLVAVRFDLRDAWASHNAVR